MIRKGSQTWPSPGVDRTFPISETTLAYALKLVDKARAQVSIKRWRVLDGDLDMKTTCGNHKGAVDGLADKDGEMASLALVELKVRRSTMPSLNAEVVSLCSALDQRWTRYKIPRLQAPWTHGILVLLCQVSCSRAFPDRDVCHVVVWGRGSPPTGPANPPRGGPRAKAKALPVPPVAIQQVAPEQKFDRLLRKLEEQGAVEEGQWVMLKSFLTKLQLPSQQTKRYLQGATAWKLGSGRGRQLVLNSDWCFRKGHRGGGRGEGHPHVKASVLKQVFCKLYSNRHFAL